MQHRLLWLQKEIEKIRDIMNGRAPTNQQTQTGGSIKLDLEKEREEFKQGSKGIMSIRRVGYSDEERVKAEMKAEMKRIRESRQRRSLWAESRLKGIMAVRAPTNQIKATMGKSATKSIRNIEEERISVKKISSSGNMSDSRNGNDKERDKSEMRRRESLDIDSENQMLQQKATGTLALRDHTNVISESMNCSDSHREKEKLRPRQGTLYVHMHIFVWIDAFFIHFVALLYHN